MQTSVPHIDELAKMAVTLGRNVKRLRERGRINKTCFAAMVGIGRPQLNKIEKGTANVRLSMVEELADALEYRKIARCVRLLTQSLRLGRGAVRF